MQTKKTSDNDDSEYVPSKESQEQTWNSSDEEVFKAKKPVRKQRKFQKPTSRRKSNPGGSNQGNKSSTVPPPPTKSPQQNRKTEHSGDLKSDGILLRQSMGFCPICQIPFDILKISAVAHTAACNVTGNAPACPDGSRCLNPTIFHYRDYSHEALANFRASEGYEEPNVVFTPQKLTATPLKRSTGKKRPAKTPLVSSSKVLKTEEEPCCSKDLQSSAKPKEGNRESMKKKLFNDQLCDADDRNDQEEEEQLPHTDVKPSNVSQTSGSELNSLPDTLVESELWCSDLLLGGSMPDDETVSDPSETMVPVAAPVQVKNEPLSQKSTDESTVVSSAKINIQYESVVSVKDVRDAEEPVVSSCNIDCSENCDERVADQDALQANCSVTFKAHGVNRDEAMTRSALAVTLMVNKSGWEAVEVKGTESTDIRKMRVTLCQCSHSVCVECCVTNADFLSDVKFNPSKTEQVDKFFSTMIDLGIKKKNYFVEPLQCGMAARKDLLERTCNRITVSSQEASNARIEEPSGAEQSTHEEPHPIIKVKDAFSLLKNNSAFNIQRSVTPPVPSKPSAKKSQSLLPAPMVVSNATGSSWTLESVPSRGGPPTFGGKKVPAYKRIPGTQIVVDAFNFGIIPGVKAYFLSHFHSDHYNGLRKDFNMPIFCSQVTANLVHLKLRVEEQYLHVLKIGEPRMVCKVEVEIFEANHCPGAVMFLFRTADGQTYLHVGDFRAHESMELYPQLRYVDKLFLDTTYCDPAYDFPPQEEVVSKVVKTVAEHLAKNKSTLIVCGTYTIVGKEKVFMGIAETFNMKIYTSTEKRRVYNCLEDKSLSNRLTTDPMSAHIHVVAMREIASQELHSYLNKYSPKFTNIIAFKPTGWTTSTSLKSKPSDFTKTSHGKVTIYGVPYSEHSSFSELRQFVRFVRPKDIQVTVNVSKAPQYKKLFQQWLTSNKNNNGQSKMVQYLTSSSTEPSR